ncbi:MAG: hypothetical protein ACRDN0_28750 [Trebonia sp.]
MLGPAGSGTGVYLTDLDGLRRDAGQRRERVGRASNDAMLSINRQLGFRAGTAMTTGPVSTERARTG